MKIIHIVWSLSKDLTVRAGPLSSAQLAFGNLFHKLDYLAPTQCKGMPQLDMACFVEAHVRPGDGK